MYDDCPKQVRPMPGRPTRSERRSQFDHVTRISLLEDDADQIEQSFNTIQASQNRTASLLLSTLGALLVGVILLAINLAVGIFPVP